MSGHATPRAPRFARTAVEVETAHELLRVALEARRAGRLDLDPMMSGAIAGAFNFACWLLGHLEDGPSDMLAEIAAELAAAGLEVVRLDGAEGRP